MTIHIGVAYATAARQVWMKFDVPEGSTLQDAITLSGILNQFPDIDLDTQKVGIFGKVKPLTTELKDGDRVEIYRPIVADPEPVLAREQAKKDADKDAKQAAIAAKKAKVAAAKAEKAADTES